MVGASSTGLSTTMRFCGSFSITLPPGRSGRGPGCKQKERRRLRQTAPRTAGVLAQPVTGHGRIIRGTIAEAEYSRRPVGGMEPCWEPRMLVQGFGVNLEQASEGRRGRTAAPPATTASRPSALRQRAAVVVAGGRVVGAAHHRQLRLLRPQLAQRGQEELARLGARDAVLLV